MAFSVGSGNQTNGFADVFGGKLFNVIDYTGPKSYNNTGTPATSGDALDPKMFGFPNSIEALIGTSTDQTGVYIVVGMPVNNGVTKWILRWFTLSGMTEVVNTTDLSAKTVKLAAVGF